MSYDFARQQCIRAVSGGTRGWRLPSIVELASLQDPSLVSGIPESIFGSFQGGTRFWSATSDAVRPTTAWVAVLGPPFAIQFDKDDPNIGVLCVRGPMQESVY
jgi:hypothetical protein